MGSVSWALQRGQRPGGDVAGNSFKRLRERPGDIGDIGAMNAVWDAWVVPGSAPPRATVQAALADPSWRIEIVVTAAVAPQQS